MEKYEALQKDYEEFTYRVSHDLNASIRQIQQFSRLLLRNLDGRLTQEDERFVAFIEKAVWRSQAMMDSLLELSRVNLVTNSFTLVDCSEVIDKVIRELHLQADGREINFKRTDLPEIFGDHRQIERVFREILKNAILFSREKGEISIKVSSSRCEHGWVFEIADKGVGIAKNMEREVFTAFKKLHADDDYPGIGMGLALSKKIIVRHGGKIWCGNTQNGGATFFILLPDIEDTEDILNICSQPDNQ